MLVNKNHKNPHFAPLKNIVHESFLEHEFIALGSKRRLTLQESHELGDTLRGVPSEIYRLNTQIAAEGILWFL